MLGVSGKMKRWSISFLEFISEVVMPARPSLAGATEADRASPDWCFAQLDANVGLNCATAMPGRRQQLDLAATTEPFLLLQHQAPSPGTRPSDLGPSSHRTRQLFHHETRSPRAYQWQDSGPTTPPAHPSPAPAPLPLRDPTRDSATSSAAIHQFHDGDIFSIPLHVADPSLCIHGRGSQLSM